MAKPNSPKRAASIPFDHSFRNTSAGLVFEVWPKSGRWFPFVASVPEAEAEKLRGVLTGPRGSMVGKGSVETTGLLRNEGMCFEIIQHPIDKTASAHVFLNDLPSIIEFGQPDGEMYTFARDDTPSGEE